MFMGEYQPKQGGKQSLGNQITQRRHSRLPCRKWWRMNLGALASSAAKGIPDLSYFRFEPEEMFAFELWTIWSFPKIGVPPNHPFFWGIFPCTPSSYWGTPISGNLSARWPSLSGLTGSGWSTLTSSPVERGSRDDYHP